MIVLHFQPYRAAAYHTYRLAGSIVACDEPLPELASFATGQAVLPSLPPPKPELPPLTVRSVRGWLVGRDVAAQGWETPSGIGVILEAAGQFDLVFAPHETHIYAYRADGVDHDSLIWALLGPPLCLALAAQAIYCVHGSAFVVANKVFILMGHSGVGKSTLAAYLGRQPAIQRIGDDMLFVTLVDGQPTVLPHFPQLKLTRGEIDYAQVPEAIPLAGIYILQPTRETTLPSIQSLSLGAQITELTQHTVSASLFSSAMRADHLTFSAVVAEKIPIRRLIYPHFRDSLPMVRDLLITPEG